MVTAYRPDRHPQPQLPRSGPERSDFVLWSDSVETHALLQREQTSVFGWRVSVSADANPRALRNFPMQANGAEMLRVACCLVTEAGIKVCAPNHDALLIEAPLDRLDEAIASVQHLMAEASTVVLDGFVLRPSVRSVRAPDRWMEKRGRSLWDALQLTLARQKQHVHRRDATCAPMNSRPILYSVSNKKNSHGTD
jgi:hypothetical protein